MNMQLSYDVSPRVQLVGTLANIFNTCWGGSTEPWTSGNGNVCGYTVGGFGSEIFPVGNIYNPAGHNGSIIQPIVKYPYGPLFGPFNQDGSSIEGSVPVLRDGEDQALSSTFVRTTNKEEGLRVSGGLLLFAEKGV